jgi:hypothetical protein
MTGSLCTRLLTLVLRTGQGISGSAERLSVSREGGALCRCLALYCIRLAALVEVSFDSGCSNWRPVYYPES